MVGRAVIMAFVAASTVFEQALPPPAPAARLEETSSLLTRTREQVLNSIRRLPKYTCLETIDRNYYALPAEKHSPQMMTAADSTTACPGGGAGDLTLDASDRLRVEVAEAGGTEIHSWPGSSRFDTQPFDEMIPFGPLSTGSFGAALSDVFANPGAQIEFTSQKADGPVDIFEYSFRVPLNASHHSVKGRRQWHVTGFSGSFEINAANAKLLRLVLETDSLPLDTGMCQFKISIDYHSLLIGQEEFIIPRRSEFQTFDRDGGQTDSVTEFSACREYMAKSNLRFDDQGTPAAPIKIRHTRVTVLPADVSFTLALVHAIDLGTAAAGDPISARVVHTVRRRGSKAVLVPADAIARGRILEMRHAFGTSQFLITLRFDTLETNGVLLPLSIRSVREIKAESRGATGEFAIRGTEFSLPPHSSMESGSRLVFRAKSGAYVIPAGFESKWTTVAP